jgi:hypothetical protein
MKEILRPRASAITPVGTSKIIIPAVKAALATNAPVSESPASSRKRVLIPQIKDAARVCNNSNPKYVLWIICGVMRVTEEIRVS